VSIHAELNIPEPTPRTPEEIKAEAEYLANCGAFKWACNAFVVLFILGIIAVPVSLLFG